MQRQTGNRSVQRALGLAPRRRQGQDVPAPVARRIQLERGGGQALDATVRRQMERALGTDFRGVRVHTGAEADVLNRSLHARAFTSGRDIFFRQGAYNPESSAGRELIAHELTHVLHQGNRDAGSTQRKMAVNQPGDRFEQEANRVAQATMRQEQHHGRPVAGGPAVQRQAEDEKKKAVQTQPEEDKDKAVQAKAEEDDKVQTQPEEDKDKAVQAKAEEDDKVQTQPEEDKDKAVQAKAEEEDKVQTQPEDDKDKAVQAKAEEEKDKAST